MFRCGPAIVIVWTILASATPAQAQWSDFWSGTRTAYQKNVQWPEPFLQPDRDSVTLPFSMMIANGWRRQNLLSDYHFTDDGSQLNLAGETKLRYILTQVPPQRRTVYVQRGLTPETTLARLVLVNRAASKLALDKSTPSIVESDLPNDGWPADDVDATSRRFIASRPDPRLSNASSSSGGGGGAGGGGGGGGGSSGGGSGGGN
jgi:uncharacterized membrane protein YgcG